MRVGIDHIAVWNEQMTIWSLCHSEWTMQMNSICVNNPASTFAIASHCRVLDCKHSIIFCRCHIQHIASGIEYETGGSNFKGSRIASVVISGCDLSHVRDHYTSIRH